MANRTLRNYQLRSFYIKWADLKEDHKSATCKDAVLISDARKNRFFRLYRNRFKNRNFGILRWVHYFRLNLDFVTKKFLKKILCLRFIQLKPKYRIYTSSTSMSLSFRRQVVYLNHQKMDIVGTTRPFFYDLKMPRLAKKNGERHWSGTGIY